MVVFLILIICICLIILWTYVLKEHFLQCKIPPIVHMVNGGSDCIKVDISELWACSRHCQVFVVRAVLLHAAWIPNVNGRTPVVVCIFSNSHQGLTVRACLAPRCSGVLQVHLTYRIMLVLIVKSWPLLAA